MSTELTCITLFRVLGPVIDLTDILDRLCGGETERWLLLNIMRPVSLCSLRILSIVADSLLVSFEPTEPLRLPFVAVRDTDFLAAKTVEHQRTVYDEFHQSSKRAPDLHRKHNDFGRLDRCQTIIDGSTTSPAKPSHYQARTTMLCVTLGMKLSLLPSSNRK